nr:MAG TPA: hypothetical protein [Caudoviricetes sp.]
MDGEKLQALEMPPRGYITISNNKSRWSGERKTAFLRIAGSKRSARASST